jgi:hypothetical protein
MELDLLRSSKTYHSDTVNASQLKQATLETVRLYLTTRPQQFANPNDTTEDFTRYRITRVGYFVV